MAKHGKRRTWKEFYISSHDDLRMLESAWQNSHATFGKNKVLEVGRGYARTNLSIRDCRALFRFADVKMPDYVTGIDED